MDKVAKALSPGTIVDVVDDRNDVIGTGYFNPHSLIAARMLVPSGGAKIGEAFFRDRFDRVRGHLDAINDLQVGMLRQVRAGRRTEAAMVPLLQSMNCIAAGLGWTG